MSTELPARLTEHLAQAVRAARRRYRKRLARCQKKFSESAVHELRVEARRILALLDLLAALRFSAALEKPARNFKRRLDAFDDLRDTQVQQRLLRPMWRDFPEARGFKTLLNRREKKHAAKLAHKIQAAKFARLNRRLKQIEKDLRHTGTRGSANNSSEMLTSAILRKSFGRVAVLRRQVRRQDPATIHRLRVAFKRYRYMNELLRPLLPGLTAKRLDRMKDYQAAAGDIQDLEVLLARLASAVENGDLKPAEVKRLRSELLRRERLAIDSFVAQVDELSGFQVGKNAARAPRRPAPSESKGNRTD